MNVRKTNQLALTGDYLRESGGLIDYAHVTLREGYVIANADDIALLEANPSFEVLMDHARTLLCSDAHPEYVRGIHELLASIRGGGMDEAVREIEFLLSLGK